MPAQLRETVAARPLAADIAHPSPARPRSRHAILVTLSTLWRKWKVLAHRIGDFQARVVLAIFYFVVFGIFALGVKIFSDPLRLRPGSGSGWLERKMPGGDPATQARRQF
jgi:hypothetical protein